MAKATTKRSTTNRSTVVGVFHDHDQAERAYRALREAGFNDDQLGIIARDRRGGDVAGGEASGGDAAEGLAVGALGGGILGGLLGAAAALLIPGIGPVVAGGVLAATLGGAAIGATAGGLIGALTNLGVPEDEAHYYDQEFRSGRTLVTVKADGRSAEAAEILRRHGAYDMQNQTPSAGATAGGYRAWNDVSPAYREEWQTRHGSTGGRWEDHEPAYRYGYEMRNDDRFRGRQFSDVESDLRSHYGTWGQSANYQTTDRDWDRVRDRVRDSWEGADRIQLRAEELIANKQRVQTGEVRVTKDVVAEERTLEVPVTREEVVIERRAVSGDRPASGPIREGGEVIEVPVMEEEVTLEKRAVVREEVRLGKREVQETEHLTDTVRHEEVRIEREGDVRVSGAGVTGAAGSGRWDEVMPTYRGRWQQRFGSSGGRWEDFEPGYRYGWEMANDQRYRGRPWTDVEADLRQDWGTRHRDKPWDRVADAIRDAWDHVTGAPRLDSTDRPGYSSRF